MHPMKAALVIAASALLFASVKPALSPAQSFSQLSPGWPPPPEAMFNFHGKNIELAGGDYLVSPGEKQVIYTVPADRWLIVTNADWMTCQYPLLFLLERVANVETVKANLSPGDSSCPYGGNLDSAGPVGLTFRPGSEVVVWNASSNGGAQISDWHLIGYEDRK